MQRNRWKQLALPALIVAATAAGCAARGPRAYVPDDAVDFGDIPVIQDMKDASYKQFIIRNIGAEELELSNVRVKTIEGC